MGYKIKHIYQGENLVRPKWKPGTNTLGYYTFNNTYADASGKNADATNSGSNTFVSAYSGSSKKVLNKVSGSYVVTPNTFLSSYPAQWTILFWYKSTQATNTWGMNAANSSKFAGQIGFGVDGYGLSIQYGGTSGHQRMAYNTGTYKDGVWHLITFRRGTGDVLVGIDNNFTTQYRLNTPQEYNLGGGEFYVGARGTSYDSIFNVGDLIIENKERTAQEIADYYSQTKSNYGL